MSTKAQQKLVQSLDQYKYGFSMPEKYHFKSEKGHSRKVIEMISHMKNEPDWMREFRLRAYEIFLKKSLVVFGRR